ncbi:MAG TPA: T9SS type A sorting domain-containing protein [Ignavibacteriaceae bacterium]|nr:T9SS type A sorting domain-containing protein [Ignavibacteriaceae bacterium]
MKKLYLYMLLAALTVNLFSQVTFKTANQNKSESFFIEIQSSKILSQADNDESPDGFNLSQNYPNPFNPSTVITYTLPEKSFVSLIIYNVLGNEIKTLVNGEKSAGIHNVTFEVADLPSELSNGTYFYMLKTERFTETKKMIYIK